MSFPSLSSMSVAYGSSLILTCCLILRSIVSPPLCRRIAVCRLDPLWWLCYSCDVLAGLLSGFSSMSGVAALDNIFLIEGNIMTIEESFAQRMDIQKTYESIQSLFSAIPSIFRQSEILENFPKAMLEDYTDLITALQQSVSSTVAVDLEHLSHTISAAIQAIPSPSDLAASISLSLQNAVSAIEWYPVLGPILPIMEEIADTDNCDTGSGLQRIKERKPLSSSQLINVFGLILTILSLWLSLQPDPQAEKIIQQNEKIIEQGQTQVQQNERIIELLEKNLEDQDITECLICAAQSVAEGISAIAGNVANAIEDSGNAAIDLVDQLENSADVHENAVDVPLETESPEDDTQGKQDNTNP